MRFWSSSPSKHSGKEGKMQIIETTGNLFRALHRQGGYTSNEERIAAIRDMPRPTNVKELRSFLGLINYYSKFIANLHPMCSRLYEFIRYGTKWRWSEAEESLFQKLKTLLSNIGAL